MKALINIRDNNVNVNRFFMYKFKNITTYKKLVEDLSIYYPEFDQKSQLIISFAYRGENQLIDDFNKYILNGDRIDIIINRKIYKPVPVYYLYDVKSYAKLKISSSVKYLYQIYETYYKNNIDCEILLFKQTGDFVKLIDVLDSPLRHYNECVNRLIRRYNF